MKQEMMVAVASAGPYANHLHFASDRWIYYWREKI